MILSSERKLSEKEAEVYSWVRNKLRLSETFIGVSECEWYYFVANFEGSVRTPNPYEYFDEIICDILLKKDRVSEPEILNILGLDAFLGKHLLQQMIQPLIDVKMVFEPEKGVFSLTSQGQYYAGIGTKFKPAVLKKFDIYFDAMSFDHENCRKSFENQNFESVSDEQLFNDVDLSRVRTWVSAQVLGVHDPAKGLFLDDFKIAGWSKRKIRSLVCLLADADDTVRLLVLNAKNGHVDDYLTGLLNSRPDDEVKTQIIRSVLSGYSTTLEEKTERQRTEDEELLAKNRQISMLQDQLSALEKTIRDKDAHHEKRIEDLKDQIENEKRTASELLKRFSSVDFVDELRRVFELCRKELWIITPFIKSKALHDWMPHIESVLNRKVPVFIAYTEPESMTNQPSSAEALNALKNKMQKYDHLYVIELPNYHYKHVIVFIDDKKRYFYNGSFNVLSFSVNKFQQKIRQESMDRTSWNTVNEESYRKHVKQFYDIHLKDFQSVIEKYIDGLSIATLKKNDIINIRAYLNKFKARLNVFVIRNEEQLKSSYLEFIDYLEQRIEMVNRYFAVNIKKEISKIDIKDIKDKDGFDKAFSEIYSIKDRVPQENKELAECVDQKIEDLNTAKAELEKQLYEPFIQSIFDQLHNDLSGKEMKRLRAKLEEMKREIHQANNPHIRELFQKAEKALIVKMKQFKSNQ